MHAYGEIIMLQVGAREIHMALNEFQRRFSSPVDIRTKTGRSIMDVSIGVLHQHQQQLAARSRMSQFQLPQ